MVEYVNPFLGRDNPYLTQKIDQAQGDLVRNYNLTAQPAYNSAMVRSGSFGNEGVAQMNENSRRNLQSELGDISTNLRGQDYRDQQSMYQWDQEFGRSLYNDAYGQQQQNLQSSLGLMDRMQAYNSNATNNANTIQNTPMNYWQQFSNSANSIGQGYGTTTNPGGGSNPWVGALGGAQLGSSLANGWGGWGGKYSGTSNNPSAPNYENSLDTGWSFR
jgi:hypothetical protein